MGRSYDEPFALYGLLAESIEVDPNHMWVEFTLRPEARFSDGSPVTVEDVIWSYETSAPKGTPATWRLDARGLDRGHGRARRAHHLHRGRPGAGADHGAAADPEGGAMGGRRFRRKRARHVPIASAPYVIDDFEAGRFVSLRRNPDYWGADLPFRRGTHNIDEVRMEFFADGTAMFEAFKAGLLTTMRETNAANWAENTISRACSRVRS
jgi:peptide/nickel transport system substrate-binding protein